MKKIILREIFIFMSLMAQCAVNGASDVELRGRLEEVLVNDHDYRAEAASVFRECGSDSNRFVRIAKGIYSGKTTLRERSRIVSLIAKYAGPSDITFLEGCVTNAAVGLPALTGILRLQGACSNSVAQVDRFCTISDVEANLSTFQVQKAFAVVNLLKDRVWNSSSTEGKRLAFDYAYSFASNNIRHVALVDEAMGRVSPTYRHSRRRLSLMRWITTQDCPSEISRLAAEVINEQTAHPEANSTD